MGQLTQVSPEVVEVADLSVRLTNDLVTGGIRKYTDSADTALRDQLNALSSTTVRNNVPVTWNYSQRFASSVAEGVVTANSGSTYTFDLSLGTVFFITLTANCTFVFPATSSGQFFTVYVKQDSTGNRTTTWPAGVAWPNSTSPTANLVANKTDAYGFNCVGNTWIGFIGGSKYSI